jgi:hypothetical protein
MSLVASYAARLTAAVAFIGLALWWVTVPHSFDGRVLFAVTEFHGVHTTDWPAVVFGVLAVALIFTPDRREPAPVRVTARR